ncbi:Fanconi anemia group J protein [Boothiomyces macroporosus]|uniref:DNA 5'-3' helicase n=1 Tax=Boothiomyces macroporosus TaxID=261099 RepID=A0AAD5UIL2_9FUNG|nr:Fanconi anemia group J protein [Boothiomyces macroporosus]
MSNRKRKLVEMWPDLVKNEKEVQRLKEMEEFQRNALQNQVQLNILGVPVNFPFKPYPSQMDIMTKELVQEGKKRKKCPYYAARLLAAGAEVVFAPYNYIIEPLIRQSCDINLGNTVLIFDEAHNIEGICADSGSVEISLDSIELAKANLRTVEKYFKDINITRIVDVLEHLTDWIDDQSKSPFPEKESNKVSKIWSGYDAVELFHGIGIDANNLNPLLADLERMKDILFREEQGQEEEGASQSKPSKIAPKLAVYTVNILTEFLMIVECLIFPDYKMILSKESRMKDGQMLFEYVLAFRCLNPGVIFQDIATKCRSVILTSGTLAPLDTYESELRAKFHDSLEASHVIKKEQIFVGLVSKGLDGKPLVGDFQTFRTQDYQDQLGMTIYRITKQIPNGILIFVPSYSWVDSLERRWTESGLWNTFERTFKIFKEPRKSKKGDLEELLKEYNESCKTKQTMLFCVFRGKMSEGIDFANERARGVICVGLPFPNVGDLKVKQKKIYNDAFSLKNNLLTGSEWFEIQAFRALNQALGRCIRHLNDWGCVVLIDARFPAARNLKMLPKWIQPFLQTFDTAKLMEKNLKQFFKNIQDLDKDNSNPNQALGNRKEIMTSPSPVTPRSVTVYDSSPLPNATPVKTKSSSIFETPVRQVQTPSLSTNSHSSYLQQPITQEITPLRGIASAKVSNSEAPMPSTINGVVSLGSKDSLVITSEDCDMPSYSPDASISMTEQVSRTNTPSISLDLSRFMYNPAVPIQEHIQQQQNHSIAVIPEEEYEEKEYHCYSCGAVVATTVEEHSWEYPFISVLGYTSSYYAIIRNIAGMEIYSGKYGADSRTIGDTSFKFYECSGCKSLTGILVDDIVLLVDKV